MKIEVKRICKVHGSFRLKVGHHNKTVICPICYGPTTNG